MADNTVNQLIINKLTKTQFDSATKNTNELYLVTDDDTYATVEQLNTKADKNTTYTKNEVNAALDEKADIDSLATVATTGSYTDLTNKPTLGSLASKDSISNSDITSDAQIDQSKINGLIDSLNSKQAAGDYISYTLSEVTSLIDTINCAKTIPDNLYVTRIITAGTTLTPGIVTRSISGSTTPDENGNSQRDNLYINYDGTTTSYNINRQIILQSNTAGVSLGNNLYQYALVRGDILKAYCDAHYATSSELNNKVDQTTFETELAKKVNIQQGAENSGKALVVGDDGNVVVGEVIPSSSGKALPILAHITSEHLFNDASWLNGNTFSWQYGSIYVTAYNHLLDDYNNSTETCTDIINGISIVYKLAADKHKICNADQEDNLILLYNQTGNGDYYILDSVNARFKLPRKINRKLIQSVKNNDYTWYNLYSDGWIEQGGYISANNTDTTTIVLLQEMENTKYFVNFTQSLDKSSTQTTINVTLIPNTQTTTSFGILSTNNLNNNSFYWQVNGYVKEPIYEIQSPELSYYYVGNFDQTALAQTAGLNTELFNQKVDVSSLGTLAYLNTITSSNITNNTITENNLSQDLINKINSITTLNNDTTIIPLDLTENDSSIVLETNKIYKLTIDGESITFNLPTEVNSTVKNKIKIYVQVVTAGSIDWGTRYFYTADTPTINTGTYDFCWEYDPNISNWAVNVYKKTYIRSGGGAHTAP